MSNVLDLKHLPADDVQEEPSPLVVDDSENIPALDGNEPEVAEAISWEAHHPLTGAARWRHGMFLGALVVVGAGISLWQHSIIPFIVILLGAGTLEIRERWGKPVAVEITARGVAIDGRSYDHASFASFHIHQMPDETLELSLKSDQRLLPHMRIPLGQQDPYEVHAVLAQYIPEGEHKIPLVDFLVRKPRE